MDQALLQEIEKKTHLIQELEESFVLAKQKKHPLHVRFAPIITENPLYELSLAFDLLDDQTQADLAPFIVDYYIPAQDTQSIADERYYGKIIPAEHLSDVLAFLGLDEVTDSTYYRDVFNKLVVAYSELYELLLSLYHESNEVEVYYGETYYPRVIDSMFAFAVDETNIFLMDYRISSVPSIFSISKHEIIQHAVEISCFAASDLEFYTTY